MVSMIQPISTKSTPQNTEHKRYHPYVVGNPGIPFFYRHTYMKGLYQLMHLQRKY